MSEELMDRHEQVAMRSGLLKKPMSESMKLKTCPFCGEEMEIIERDRDFLANEYWFIPICTNFGCIAHKMEFKYTSYKDAVNAVNTRAPREREEAHIDGVWSPRVWLGGLTVPQYVRVMEKWKNESNLRIIREWLGETFGLSPDDSDKLFSFWLD